jgi:hypothetical protein
MRKWWAWLGIILAAGTTAGAVHAEYRGGTIRIGVLNDQSGLYADIAGTAWQPLQAEYSQMSQPRARTAQDTHCPSLGADSASTTGSASRSMPASKQLPARLSKSQPHLFRRQRRDCVLVLDLEVLRL